MIPPFSISSSSSSSPSSISTTIKVDKATSELLVGPDWTMNMELCDLCNANRWMAKDVVKGVKRRLQHKNPRVQLLTLTLLETMVENCGEYIHHQIADRKVLDEMTKIVKKKGDLHVREKVLILVDSWQEAFGGPGGKYSQYYWACDELRRFGARFPQHSQWSVPVVTPPINPQPRVPQICYGASSQSSQRLDEAMASEVEGLSSSTLASMRNASELLDDMLQAVNPNDRMAVKDEVIVDLVEHCRTKQKKLVQMITTTTDEDLLAQGLKMNDCLQCVLAKHDAIATGAPLLGHRRCTSVSKNDSVQSDKKISEAAGDKHPTANGNSPVSAAPSATEQVDEEDDSALLIRRNSKTQSGPSRIVKSGGAEDGASSSGSNNVLALIDVDVPPPETAITASKEQDLIDLLSIVLTTSSAPETSQVPSPASAQNHFEASFDSYVVPWAQTQPQHQPQQAMQTLPQLQNQYQTAQPQTNQAYSQYTSTYPPPPWEATSVYSNTQNLGSNPYMYQNYQGNINNGYNAATPIQGPGTWSSQNANAFQYPQYGNQQMLHPPQSAVNGSLQHSSSFQNTPSMNGTPAMHTNSFPAKSALNGTTITTNGDALNHSGQKPFTPTYRLFDDLNVLRNSDSKLKTSPYPSASGNPNPNPNIVSGRR